MAEINWNFEKDIDVPSKSKIMYDYNAKDCEQCNPDSVCCYCKNITCYKLEDDLKAKEQECEELKKSVEHWQMEHKEVKAKGEWTYDLVKKRLGQQLDQLKVENEQLKTKVFRFESRQTSMGEQNKELKAENDKLKKQNEIMLKSLKKLQNKLCSSTSQCKYFLMDVLKEVEK